MNRDIKGSKVRGYVILPCFKVIYDRITGECMFLCGEFMWWIFETFFAPFWTGKVHIKEDDEVAE